MNKIELSSVVRAQELPQADILMPAAINAGEADTYSRVQVVTSTPAPRFWQRIASPFTKGVTQRERRAVFSVDVNSRKQLLMQIEADASQRLRAIDARTGTLASVALAMTVVNKGALAAGFFLHGPYLAIAVGAWLVSEIVGNACWMLCARYGLRPRERVAAFSEWRGARRELKQLHKISPPIPHM